MTMLLLVFLSIMSVGAAVDDVVAAVDDDHNDEDDDADDASVMCLSMMLWLRLWFLFVVAVVV